MNIKVEDLSYEVLRRALMLVKLIQVKRVVSSTSPSPLSTSQKHSARFGPILLPPTCPTVPFTTISGELESFLLGVCSKR